MPCNPEMLDKEEPNMLDKEEHTTTACEDTSETTWSQSCCAANDEEQMKLCCAKQLPRDEEQMATQPDAWARLRTSGAPVMSEK